MKKPYQLFAVCAVGALSFGTLHAEQIIKPATEVTAKDKADKVQTVQLKVTGMTWGVGCTAKVRSALTAVKGVSKAVVTMPDKAVVTAKKDVTTKDLIAAIKAAGYGASVATK